MERDFFLDRYMLIECPDGTFVIHKVLRKIREGTYVMHPISIETGDEIPHLGHVLINIDNLTSEAVDYPKAQIFDEWASVMRYFENIGAHSCEFDEDEEKSAAPTVIH